MRSKIFLFVLIPITFSILITCKQRGIEWKGSIEEENYPSDFNSYGLTLFGSVSLLSPWHVIRIDNNWEILLACISGKNKTDLKSEGISFVDSQLQLLRIMRLLEIEEERLKTKMPILGSEQTLSLRKIIRNSVVKIEPTLRSDIDNFKSKLEKQKRNGSAYPILFSYILDGLPWTYFYKKGLIPEWDQDTPIWDGLYWAIYPPRRLSSGTNSWDGRYASVRVTTGVDVDETLWKGFRFSNLKMIRDEFVEHGKIISKKLIEELVHYEVVDAEGNLTIPIINEDDESELYLVCRSLANKVAASFLDNLNTSELMKKYKFNTESEALIVSFHEFIWELLEFFEEKGIVKKPSFFYSPEKATYKDLGNLIFIIKRPTSTNH